MKSPILFSYTDVEDKMTAIVVNSDKGGYRVCLRDDESMQIVPAYFLNFDDIEIAKAKAQSLVKQVPEVQA